MRAIWLKGPRGTVEGDSYPFRELPKKTLKQLFKDTCLKLNLSHGIKEDWELRVLAKLENGAFLAVQGLSFAFQCGFDPWSGS